MNELYDGLPDIIDSIAESMQADGILTGYNQSITINQTLDLIAYVEELRTYLKNNRQAVSTESYVQNQIDSLLELINSTLYKLKYLS